MGRNAHLSWPSNCLGNIPLCRYVVPYVGFPGLHSDVFNERPMREEQTITISTVSQRTGPSPLANEATIHTTFWDIHIRLFLQQAPLAVENFVDHARSGYLKGVIFHHAIPKFMIQTAGHYS